MLPRVLETEAMDTPAEAAGYDSMDHREVNQVFVADLLAARPAPGEMLDLGTGTALIPIELCRQDPTARVLAVDVAENMLRLARRNVEQAGLGDRIRLQRIDAKGLPFAEGTFSTVISNSIVHHVPEPGDVLREAWRVAAAGGLLFIRDLMRPDDDETVQRLVDTYAADATEHQRQMFDDSLRAALTVEEMRRFVGEFGQAAENVCATTDRHWTWMGRKV
ncbi:MAG TPA: methyltransferase domain-containing protein [Thermoguttaceae bacterium]|nr:methyltransferase domain-containing protein [Thermoguttaceae bacterium]